MSRRLDPGRFGGPFGHVRYTSRTCGAGEHERCNSGVPDHRRGELMCSCPCHLERLAAVLAYESTVCRRGEHEDCPSLRDDQWAEVAGRRDPVSVPCTCGCHAPT